MCGSKVGVIGKIGGFLIMGWLKLNTWSTDTSWNAAIPEGGKSSSAGASGANSQRFTLFWKGARNKTRLTCDEQWDGEPKLEKRDTNGVPQQSSSRGVGYNVPNLKCFYTKACSMWNKHTFLGQSFGPVPNIRHPWHEWDNSCGWSALLGGYRLFRRDMLGWRGELSLCVIEGLECMVLTVVSGIVESLWVWIKEQISNVDVIVVLY